MLMAGFPRRPVQHCVLWLLPTIRSGQEGLGGFCEIRASAGILRHGSRASNLAI